MPDNAPSAHTDASLSTPFDELMNAAPDSRFSTGGTGFATVFRGYDRDDVDAAVSRLTANLATESQRAVESAARADAAAERVARLEGDLTAVRAQLAEAESRIAALTEELADGSAASPNRRHFEEVLRVAEEQASTIIHNATNQADKLLQAASAEGDSRRAEAEADAAQIIARANSEAEQVRLRMQTELTVHTARLEREAAASADAVVQAEQEAAAIRTEAEKAAATTRAAVARETEQSRAAAEEAVRELRMRAAEFEESLTRRQDDAQQEFLVLHNQAVAHAERITTDANAQVAAALEHSQRITAKADDFDKLMRSQAQQIEADARMRASEHLERAREKAQRIIDAVTAQADTVLRDAEDRTRQLRWQQHQLTSFMAEVKEMIRPDGVSAQPPSSEWEPSEYRDAAAGADIAPTGDGAAEHA